MIEKMNHHYSMTNPATVYGEEALTALELVGRTTAKLNETVEAFNTLEKNTGDHLNSQDKTIENRMKEQDDSITHIKDVTVPEEVSKEMQKQIDEGTFDAKINQSLNNLNERVDNLLGSMTTGGTTMDAEVIDSRVGYNGVVYDNAGQAIREQIGNVYEDMASIELTQTAFHVHGKNMIDPNAEGFIHDAYYNREGVLTPATGYHQSDFTRVTPGVKYTSNEYQVFVNWYDKSKNQISYTDAKVFGEQGYVVPPEGAYYGRFICRDMGSFIVCEGENPFTIVYEPYYCYIPRKYIGLSADKIVPQDTTFFNISPNLVDKNDPDVIIGGYYNISNEYIEHAGYNMTGFIRVDDNCSYAMNLTRVFVLFYNIDKTLVGSIESQSNVTGVITIPNDVSYVRIPCAVADWPTIQFEKGFESTEYHPFNCEIDPKYLPVIENGVSISDLVFTSYGDSITARGGWQNYLVAKYRFTHVNLGIGSTTMQYAPEYESTLPCMVNADRIQRIKDSNADIITIMGGANDAVRGQNIGTSAEITKPLAEKNLECFYGAYSYLIETLLTWKPTVTIILMTTMQTNVSGYSEFYRQCADATREIAHYYSLPLVDTERESGITPYNTMIYTSDGVHPNDAGNKRIANLVSGKLADLFNIR